MRLIRLISCGCLAKLCGKRVDGGIISRSATEGRMISIGVPILLRQYGPFAVAEGR